MKAKIDIVIPSFNAKDLLQKNLPQVLRNSPQADKIIVVDDGSADGTQAFLKTEFPAKVNCLHNLQNQGFPVSVNQGFKASRADLVVLLNNDVLPQEGYIENALGHFDDPQVFAVSFNEKHSSWPLVSWRNGKYQFIQARDKTKPVYSPWASGGSAIFRLSVWNKLGGFNPIYSPGYWEDIDISWRAWKAGFRIIWEPSAKVIHQHESSFQKLDQNYVNLVKQRNELLFIWQNFSNLNYWLSHLWFLLSHSLAHPGYLKVILAALLKISAFRRIKNSRFSDQQALTLFGQPLKIN